MKGIPKTYETKIETWCGYNIRFIEKNGEWWAILKDMRCIEFESRRYFLSFGI